MTTYDITCNGCGRRFSLREGDALNVQILSAPGQRTRCMGHYVTRAQAQPQQMQGAKPRPVHVEFWRCGKVGEGRGWQRCLTSELCKNHGCQKVGRHIDRAEGG